MKTLFSTAGLHPRDTFDYWHEAANRWLAGHDSHPIERVGFDASIRAGTLADLGLFDFTTGALDNMRTARNIAAQGKGEFFLCRQGAGNVAIEQGERRSTVASGELVLIDSNRPYRSVFTAGSRMLMVKIPRRVVESRFGSVTELVGTRIVGSDGVNRLLAATLVNVAGVVEQLDEAAGETVRNQLVDLLALSLRAMLGEDRRLSAPRALAVMRLRSAIEARLADPDLDSETVAKAAGVSVRYANALLAHEGSSLARLIRETRLQRCRAALDDPGQDHRSIAEIAFGWGFADVSTFGRLFRAYYHTTPRAYRQSRDCPRALVGAGR